MKEAIYALREREHDCNRLVESEPKEVNPEYQLETEEFATGASAIGPLRSLG